MESETQVPSAWLYKIIFSLQVISTLVTEILGKAAASNHSNKDPKLIPAIDRVFRRTLDLAGTTMVWPDEEPWSGGAVLERVGSELHLEQGFRDLDYLTPAELGVAGPRVILFPDNGLLDQCVARAKALLSHEIIIEVGGQQVLPASEKPPSGSLIIPIRLSGRNLGMLYLHTSDPTAMTHYPEAAAAGYLTLGQLIAPLIVLRRQVINGCKEVASERENA